MEDIKPNCGSNVQAGLQMAIDDVALYPSVLVRHHFKFFRLDPLRFKFPHDLPNSGIMKSPGLPSECRAK